MECIAEGSFALVVLDSQRVKTVRIALETQGLYDNAYRITKLENGSFAVPLSEAGSQYFHNLIDSKDSFPQNFVGCFLAKTQLPPSKKELAKTSSDHVLLHKAMEQLLSQFNLTSNETDDLLSDLPSSWEKHGDLILLPSSAFTHEAWSQLSHRTKNTSTVASRSQEPPIHSTIIWNTVASVLKCKRLAINDRVKCDKYRSSSATLVLGNDGWVEHIDNGVKYTFDITKVMFSSGNVTEKLRVAGFKCEGETVLDLYAGIGYFTLPYLVHAKAELVHACEWNSDAVDALERGLEANRVKGRCVVHYGDNRTLKLKNFADRVNLGLIPSSEEGWPVACAALKRSTGGWLHIHGNVSTYTKAKLQTSTAATCKEGDRGREQHGAESNPWTKIDRKVDICVDDLTHGDLTDQKELIHTTSSIHSSISASKREKWKEWACYVEEAVSYLLDRENPLPGKVKQWRVRVRELVHVKSYAPHVDHLVADVECRPIDV